MLLTTGLGGIKLRPLSGASRAWVAAMAACCHFFVLKLSTKFSPSHFANGGGLLWAVGQVVAVAVAVAVDRDDLEQIQLNLNLGDLGSDLPSL